MVFREGVFSVLKLGESGEKNLYVIKARSDKF